MARKDISMSETEVTAFLAVGTTAIVTTIGKTGHPHTAPMWYFLEDDKIVFRSFTKSQKIVNLRRDPRITVLVERGTAYSELQAVMIMGTARLIDGADDSQRALDAYGILAAKYAMVGADPVEMDPETLEATFGRHAPKNTVVVVEPEHIASWDHTKLQGSY